MLSVPHRHQSQIGWESGMYVNTALPLRAAVTAAVRDYGRDILRHPRRLTAYLLDVTDAKSHAEHTAIGLLDDTMLQPLVLLFDDCSLISQNEARERIYQELTEEHYLDAEISQGVTDALVEGVVDAVSPKRPVITAGPACSNTVTRAIPDELSTYSFGHHPNFDDSHAAKKGSKPKRGTVLVGALLCAIGLLVALFWALSGVVQTSDPQDESQGLTEVVDESATSEEEPAPSSSDKAQESLDNESEGHPSAGFPRTWTATMLGIDRDGNAQDRYTSISMRFTEISEGDTTSRVRAICAIEPDEYSPQEATGSYYVYGSIDWESGAIELYPDDWINQGGLAYRREYSGYFNQSFTSVLGTCEVPGKPNTVSTWTMTAE